MAASSLSQFPTITPTTGFCAFSTVVSRTSISFENKTIPICIKAFIDVKGTFYTPHKPSMVFGVEREDEPEYDIGRFSIMRTWGKIDAQGNYQSEPHYEGDPIENGDRLRHRRLYVGGMVDHLEKDSVTGTFPITQIMTQLAVEILHRESEKELVIDCESDRNFEIEVLFSGGFARKTIELLGTWVGSMGILWKNSQGQLLTSQENEEADPARVAFCANKTWEQVIQERPLLNYAPGPIMPVFANLSAYERDL